MSSWSSSWGLRLCWSIVNVLFCCRISDKHAARRLASWNLQNGVTSRHSSLLSSTWHPLGSHRAFGRHSAMTMAGSLAGAGSCSEQAPLPRSHGKWERSPGCDALSIFKHLEELQGQCSVGRVTTEITLSTTHGFSHKRFLQLRKLWKTWSNKKVCFQSHSWKPTWVTWDVICLILFTD